MKKYLIAGILVMVLLAAVGCKPKADVTVKREVPADMVAPRQYTIIDFETTEATTLTIPAAEDTEATIQLAYQLYAAANRNDQNCRRRVANSQCIATTNGKVNNSIELEIKNEDEYLKYEYRPFASHKILFIKITIDGYGRATYARRDLARSYQVEVDDSVIKDWVGKADFGDTQGTLYLNTDEFYFHASQLPLYEATEAIVLPETIRSATVTHDDEGGFYTVYMELNVNVATTVRILEPKLQANSGLNDAYYQSIVKTFEIWDNGFFKSATSLDKWVAVGEIVKGTIDFRTSYGYSEAECDMNAYNDGYYTTIKAKCEAANAAEAAGEN